MRPGTPPLHVLLAAAAVQLPLVAGSYKPPAKYLIVSNARNGTIGYAKVPPGGGAPSEVRTLVDSGLGHPQGIAVDQKRQLLLVADSDLRKVVSYGLYLHADGSLAVDEQTPLAEDVEARWVAVDGPGNVYFSDEMGSRLLRVSARQVFDGDTNAEVVFPRGQEALGSLSAPGGLATDNFYLYWANKLDGQRAGTLVKGLEAGPNGSSSPLAAQPPAVLASNAPKAYGVCVAVDNVFFTAPERDVYAVKTSGGNVATVTSGLRSPRGCAWDGDATVYVADRSAHAVYALPGPMVSLVQTTATQVLRFEDAFGVAVFSGGRRSGPLALLALLPALLAAALR
mmetsp:Transcript_112540/g.363478  ORF Transcript_112540/g.363478 Transcript_112540/m.363478 type:complete len:340 (+) Transcript_112540:121-1140(+)